MKNKAAFTRAIILLTAIFFLPACSGGKKKTANLQEITSAVVERKDLSLRVLFTGNIMAEDAFVVYPRAPGKVSKKLVKEGDSVKRNQPIVMLERDEVGFSFRPMPVVSLIDGIVGQIDVDVGTFVDLKDPVATVVRPGKIRVKLDVPERYLDTMKIGSEVQMEVDHLPNEKFTGSITSVSPYLETKTRTAVVEVGMQNEKGLLRHGMFGRLYLVIEEHKGVLSIPNKAVSWEGDKRFVYKIQGNKVSRTQITTGLRDNGNVEVLGGLSEGDAIAIGSLLDLKDNEEVEILENAPRPADIAPSTEPEQK